MLVAKAIAVFVLLLRELAGLLKNEAIVHELLRELSMCMKIVKSL